MFYKKLMTLISILLLPAVSYGESKLKIESTVKLIAKELMEKHKIPGMAIGIVKEGEASSFTYGLASVDVKSKVTDNTLFEVGSVSKTFTGALASYAHIKKIISLSDETSKYWPSLIKTPFDRISLLNLGTYTAGGLPLQGPSSLKTEKDLMKYYKNWKPSFSPGTHRVYSNPSIALLGRTVAKVMETDFESALKKYVFSKIGMTNTYLSVPENKMKNYAWGYNSKGNPIRMSPAILAPQTYGARATIVDMVKFIQSNIDGVNNDPILSRALLNMQRGYFKINPMTQALVWEKYPYPPSLEDLLAGNSKQIIFKPTKAKALPNRHKPKGEFLFNKTGSTNGFGAYILFVPSKRIGVVILANKNYSIKSRIDTAYRLLKALE
jgi:beta-lactamase class C